MARKNDLPGPRARRENDDPVLARGGANKKNKKVLVGGLWKMACGGCFGASCVGELFVRL